MYHPLFQDTLHDSKHHTYHLYIVTIPQHHHLPIDQSKQHTCSLKFLSVEDLLPHIHHPFYLQQPFATGRFLVVPDHFKSYDWVSPYVMHAISKFMNIMTHRYYVCRL